MAGGEAFDGETRVATFPGDLPADPEALFKGDSAFRAFPAPAQKTAIFGFSAFGRPHLESQDADGPMLPHIRLDRALQFPDRDSCNDERPRHRKPATFKLDDPGVT